jgi:hypothetical protein
MLRNVLEDYLDSIIERDFDYPLLTLLQAMGYYDIHFTHGTVEFGKDFIAKKDEEDTTFQYAIQSKRGNIGQAEWRNNIRGQLDEAIISDLSHPQFDSTLARKVVLVTTGRISGNAKLAAQEYKAKLQAESAVRDLIFWEKEQLIQFAEEYGLTGIYQNTVKGLKSYAQFYLVYSKAIEGTLSEREIEAFSRLWIDDGIEQRKRILRATLETEILASKLLENERLYEAVICYLGLARLVMLTVFENDDALLSQIHSGIVNEKLIPLCDEFISTVKGMWEGADKSLIPLCMTGSNFPMLHYIVWCARILELSSLYWFLTTDIEKRAELGNFLAEFVQTERGCGHIPSDRYSTSVIWSALALLGVGRGTEAIDLVRRSVVWLCDRGEDGFGIARYEASEYEETATILGYPFEFIKVEKNRSSFFANALADLAAFIGDRQLYEDVINDIEACEITYAYWQFPDSAAVFSIETPECLAYANVPHDEALTDFHDLNYAAHIRDEPTTFQFVEKCGAHSAVLLSVLLRDRYFPTVWKQLVN